MAFNTTSVRLDYEFTKSFLASAEKELRRLDGLSAVGRTFFGGVHTVENFTLATFGEVAGGAAGMLRAVIRPIDRIYQKRKKFLAVNIIGSQTSENLQNTFRSIFIELGVHAYYAYEGHLNNIYLEAGPSTGDLRGQGPIHFQRSDHLQAIQILAGYAGATCFRYMLTVGTKENLIHALNLNKNSAKIKSMWKAKTREKLYYWIPAQGYPNNNGPGRKSYVSAYEFFLNSSPNRISRSNLLSAVQQISHALVYDESFNFKQSLMVNIKEMNVKNSEHRELNQETNFNVKEVQREIQETKQLVKKTSETLEEVVEKIDIIYQYTNKGLQSRKVRFNIRDPIDSFTGREDYLKTIHTGIQENREAGSLLTVISQASVIAGLGGIGKTETVRMYIYRFGWFYDHIVWIDAKCVSTIEHCFRRLATEELQISTKGYDSNTKEMGVILKEIYEKLCFKSQLLLVFDNAESLNDTPYHSEGIHRFLPQSLPSLLVKPTILITSRNQDWGQLNVDARVIHLGLWGDDECIAFGMKQLGLESTFENRALCLELGQLFDRFPLALQSAVAVIRQQSKRKELVGRETYGIQNLLDEYKCGKRDVLNSEPLHSPAQSKNKSTMLVIWNVTLDKIRGHCDGELAIKILNVMAYLSPTAVPKELLCGLFIDQKDGDFLSALELLCDYSLVEKSEEHFSIHRMIQAVTIEQQRMQGNKLEVLVLIWLIEKLKQFWQTLSKSHKIYDNFLENAIHVTELISQKIVDEKDSEIFVEFVEFVADEIMEIRMEEAGKLYEKLIAHASVSNGLAHRKTQRYKSRLVDVQRLKEDYEQALCNYTDLVNEATETYGLDDPFTLETKHGLACVLESQGKYEQAKKLYFEVLEVRENVLGPQHSKTLSTKHNIAGLLYTQNKYKEAFLMCSDILKLREETFGSNHAETLATKHLMASIQNCRGLYGKAVQMYEEVLRVQEWELGTSHPDTLETKHNMASILHNQGNQEAALRIFREVLAAREKVQGGSHPDTLKTLYNIACVLEKEGKQEEALKMFYNVLAVQEKTLGSSHPDTLVTKKRF